VLKKWASELKTTTRLFQGEVEQIALMKPKAQADNDTG
jgi:hypothetical protein